MSALRNAALRSCAVLFLGSLSLLHTRNLPAQQAGTAYCATRSEGLCAPPVFSRFSPLEQIAASANQATFDTLDPVCAPDATGTPQCTGDVLSVYEEVRELVHTANSLAGNPSLPTEFSLELDQEGLGFALRWTAAEEMAAQGSITTEFAANQLAALAARVAALRWGLTGLRTAASWDPSGRVIVAGTGAPLLGGGASGDDEWVSGRWGWFLDGSFGYGSKEDTTFISTPGAAYEDGFDFDGQEITLGTDYRFSESIALGLALGYSDKQIDFDSAVSIVDGDIDTDGYSGQLYLLMEGEHAYLSASLGYQVLSMDVRRRIVYPSFNPDVPSADSTALSSVDSASFIGSVGGGYQFRSAGFAAEPYIDVRYVDATIDGFSERSFPTGSPGSSGDFAALRIGEQSIESLNLSLGLRLQYVFTPPFGVLIPYLRGAYHQELLDDSRDVIATYEGALAQLIGGNGTSFIVPTDAPDEEYYTVSAGLSVALPAGLQGFLQYLEVFDLDFYDESVISGGVRYEF